MGRDAVLGLPALRHDAHAAALRPHLRVVSPKRKAAPSRRRRVSHAAAYQAFVFFAVAVAVVATLGVGRVWLSVLATQASIDSTKLRQDIKNERYRGDLLEVQQSALATPSRILAIASGTLGMAPATSVAYLRLTSDEPAVAAPVGDAAPQQVGILERAMDIAAGEAQVLLVGDVGLASSR
jgi:cell division protein FtsL